MHSHRVRRIAMPVAICIAAGVVMVLWYLSEPGDSEIEVRFTNLQDVVGTQQDLWTRATDNYVPKVQGRIDDLTTPAAMILRKLPGVARVEQPLRPARVSDRLIHVLDWHYVTKEWFAKDNLARASISPTDLDLRYQEFLLQVELVQMEQMATFRCAIKHHGLRRVYIERLTLTKCRHSRTRSLRSVMPSRTRTPCGSGTRTPKT
jgi:hypothetical protein